MPGSTKERDSCAMPVQAAHEAEAASLRAAVRTAQEECSAAQARVQADAGAHEEALAALRQDIETLTAETAAMEANLRAHPAQGPSEALPLEFYACLGWEHPQMRRRHALLGMHLASWLS